MSGELRVGLNLVFLEERSGGAGTYARELIPALLAAEPRLRLTAFASRDAPGWLRDAAGGDALELVELPVSVTHGPPDNLARLAAAQWAAIPWLAARRRLHVVHGLANVAPLRVPRAATVVTLLDLIWLRFAATLDRRVTLGMKLTALPSARAADRVIAISEWAREDLVATLGLPRDRVDVTLLGVRPDAERASATPAADLRARLGLGGAPVVLSVGQKREHKNQLALIRALPRLANPATRLVLPGAVTPYEDTLRAEADALGVAERVVFPEWLSAEDLEGLYALATCFALPSLEEGFGLPILEAMGRGVPVACSDASCLPEVAGDAALVFDPRDPADVARALDRLLREPALRDDLRARGRRRAGAFPWSATAEATLATYARAIR